MYEEVGIFSNKFIARTNDIVEISVPFLTPKEKLWIDKNIQAIRSGKIHEIEFELGAEMLERYCEFYRHYPNYQELLL